MPTYLILGSRPNSGLSYRRCAHHSSPFHFWLPDFAGFCFVWKAYKTCLTRGKGETKEASVFMEIIGNDVSLEPLSILLKPIDNLQSSLALGEALCYLCTPPPANVYFYFYTSKINAYIYSVWSETCSPQENKLLSVEASERMDCFTLHSPPLYPMPLS